MEAYYTTTTWEDIVDTGSHKEHFLRHVVRPLSASFRDDYEHFGVDAGIGHLMYGPRGCGKRLIAEAVANEAGARFLHVEDPKSLNTLGEVRALFNRARTFAPCIIFIDGVDALTQMTFIELKVELEGADGRSGVFLIASTNSLEDVDRNLLRPGLLGSPLFVPLPSPAQRGLILQCIARKQHMIIDDSVAADLVAPMKTTGKENLEDAFKLIEDQTVSDLGNDAGLKTVKEDEVVPNDDDDAGLKKVLKEG
ncbi:hypothetical protein ABFS83_10G144900 [Erythranthe nasuta]